MKQLTQTELQQVSGGDFTFTLELHVGQGVASWMTGIFSQLLNGQMLDANAFMTAMQNAIQNGANFNLVRLETVEFSEFN